MSDEEARDGDIIAEQKVEHVVSWGGYGMLQFDIPGNHLLYLHAFNSTSPNDVDQAPSWGLPRGFRWISTD